MIESARIQYLNDKPINTGYDSDYVLYWMQQSQRTEYNHALDYAILQANELGQPLVVGFGLADDYPEANLRHYTFMLQGLQEVAEDLASRKIKFVVQKGSPDSVAIRLAANASMVVCDRGYVRIQRRWRSNVAEEIDCSMVQVESDVVVPIEDVSNKAEYAARTIRPKVHRQLEKYLVKPDEYSINHSSLDLEIDSLDLSNLDGILKGLKLDTSVPAVDMFTGGTSVARAVLKDFLSTKFTNYDKHRNQPQTNSLSHMSKYLHFGQISPLCIALNVLAMTDRSGIDSENIETYIEELIVRRELAINFTYFTPDYDSYTCLPNWAAKTLAEHRDDPRPNCYTADELDAAETHDPYWNAAMNEMKYTGYMHNYMRMYWGKKILEWMETPEEAFATALALNNKYFIDGRDPNSFAGVAWIFGVHDRAWKERPIFGKIRYMAASGLERKCDIAAYVRKVEGMVGPSALP